MEAKCDSEMPTLGFMKSTIDDKEEDLSFTFFNITLVSVLQQHISDVTMESLSNKPRVDIDRQVGKCLSHPASTDLGKKAIPAVEISIKKFSSADVSIKKKKEGLSRLWGSGRYTATKSRRHSTQMS